MRLSKKQKERLGLLLRTALTQLEGHRHTQQLLLQLYEGRKMNSIEFKDNIELYNTDINTLKSIKEVLNV